MKITNKDIREYFGHNGVECRVRIRRDGTVERYGSPNPTDRSKDSWIYLGERGELAGVLRQEFEQEAVLLTAQDLSDCRLVREVVI